MIFECNTRLIVMTTNLIEKSRRKSENYFTSFEKINATMGDLGDVWTCESVRTEKVASREDQTIFKRTIVMKGPDDETREIIHLQYHNWPDFGAADPKLFLQFHRVIEEEESKFLTEDHPPLFHCSAGMGRTGTTLALKLILKQRPEEINIDQTIKNLRTQRAGMVQSAVQYKMIARVFIEFFKELLHESQS